MSHQHDSTFQSIILTLQRFWADQGCLIWQPYHTEVGAGTLNSATALRVLGPEPWDVAYVEPSTRPADGRYGQNPNRWQHYYQFQVILKPDPGNPQERYLQSLVALGVDPTSHDIRFVEDNWEAPALGAWGLGWEVWLDGQEISQYTYFQQAGGLTLDPVSVEITYGLERIAMVLQDAESFVDLHWTENRTYGDIYLDSERDFSKYNFELADVNRLRELYERYEAEAIAALDAGLVYPAHDYVLKCSHTFNILDARGVVGVTERAALFRRMRKLSSRVAEAYLAEREAAGFPWLEKSEPQKTSTLEAVDGKATADAANFLLEIGTEELPPSDLESAMIQLESSARGWLSEAEIDHGQLRVLGTPRRLVLLIDDLAAIQAGGVETVKGPPAEKAYDADGNPSKAAIGFAASRGLDVAALRTEAMDGGEYVVAEVEVGGKPTEALLRDQIPAMIKSIHVPRTMRWNQSGVSFARPIRWLLALYGDRLISFTYAGLDSGRTTRSLRYTDPETLEVTSIEQYQHFLADQGILLDPVERRHKIAEQIQREAEEVEGQILDDPSLMIEVTHLVEAPSSLRGAFDETFLELPDAVLVEVMKKHQRYFPVYKDGALQPQFVVVVNGEDKDDDLVRRGNEAVLKARFADAQYFLERDRQQPLEDYLPALATLTFQTDLGSMLDKSERVEGLIDKIGPSMGLDGDDLKFARRAAQLAKADHTTLMVIEMTSLQGVMGRQYALESGEPAEVADAILEQYLPKYAGDRPPQTLPGIALGMSDRLDSLAALFAAGLRPKGAGDPYGLRRVAAGVVEILVQSDIHFDVRMGLEAAAEEIPVEMTEEAMQACFDFIVGRQRQLLRNHGNRHDVVQSVLAEQGHDPVGAAQGVSQLEEWIQRDIWSDLLHAYARSARITRDLDQTLVLDEGLLDETAEKELFKAFLRVQSAERKAGSVKDFLEAIEELISPINEFFDDVLVMVDDPEIKQNRLALLQGITALGNGVVDLSHMEGF